MTAGEISYDLVMEADMSFVEGAFRLPGGAWQVVIVARGSVPTPQIEATVWPSGVSGVFVTFPGGRKLDKSAVEELLGRTFGVPQWDEVRGPDSMQLR